MNNTLIGTSICKDTECINCLVRLRCSFVSLETNLKAFAEVLRAPIEELFPALAFHKLIIERE